MRHACAKVLRSIVLAVMVSGAIGLTADSAGAQTIQWSGYHRGWHHHRGYRYYGHHHGHRAYRFRYRGLVPVVPAPVNGYVVRGGF